MLNKVDVNRELLNALTKPSYFGINSGHKTYTVERKRITCRPRTRRNDNIVDMSGNC